MINNNELINEIKSYNKFLNHDSLNKAFKFAVDAHKNQKRDEGVPYIIHPVAVAKILTDLKLDSATITTDCYMTQLKIRRSLMKQLRKNLVKVSQN